MLDLFFIMISCCWNVKDIFRSFSGSLWGVNEGLYFARCFLEGRFSDISSSSSSSFSFRKLIPFYTVTLPALELRPRRLPALIKGAGDVSGRSPAFKWRVLDIMVPSIKPVMLLVESRYWKNLEDLPVSPRGLPGVLEKRFTDLIDD